MTLMFMLEVYCVEEVRSGWLIEDETFLKAW